MSDANIGISGLMCKFDLSVKNSIYLAWSSVFSDPCQIGVDSVQRKLPRVWGPFSDTC